MWLLLPLAAFAQASSATLTGTVKDTTGGVLPGVTINAKTSRPTKPASTVSGHDGAVPHHQPSARHVRGEGRAAGLQDDRPVRACCSPSATPCASTSPWKSARSPKR